VEENRCQNDLPNCGKMYYQLSKVSMHVICKKKSIWRKPFTHKHIYDSTQLLADHTSWM